MASKIHHVHRESTTGNVHIEVCPSAPSGACDNVTPHYHYYYGLTPNAGETLAQFAARICQEVLIASNARGVNVPIVIQTNPPIGYIPPNCAAITGENTLQVMTA